MFDDLKQKIKGNIRTDDSTKKEFSHDASLFEVVPEVVIEPKDKKDIIQVIEYANKKVKEGKDVSITARSAGTCMSGGSINESIILSFTKFMNQVDPVKGNKVVTEPGVFYRDFEKETLKAGMIMPSYPASRELCAMGGIVNNNSGGEKSLAYGKTEKFVKRLEVVLSDGSIIDIQPINIQHVLAKAKLPTLEGRIYKEMYEMLDKNYDQIKDAKPRVSKNSTGYNLWNVYDRDTDTFDMTQLIVGSQGTLGIVTKAEFELVKTKKHSGMIVGYLKDLDSLGEVSETILRYKPTSYETFDDTTFKFAFKFFFTFRKTLGWGGLIKLAFSLIPDAFILARTGVPKLLVLAEFEDDDKNEISTKLSKLNRAIKDLGVKTTVSPSAKKSKKYWLMRRESFNLLRKNVKDKHTAPFIDDLVIPPEHFTKFLPELKTIIKKYDLLATIAGHLGDGNFHIIPLMDLSVQSERDKIEPALLEVIELVKKYEGIISGEHNDGMIRGPFLEEVYGKEVTDYFREVKNLFDPDNILNPHKKTDADWEWSKSHIRRSF